MHQYQPPRRSRTPSIKDCQFKDAPILAAACVADVDILVTGDRTHFGHLYGKTVEGLQVLTLKATLERLLEDP